MKRIIITVLFLTIAIPLTLVITPVIAMGERALQPEEYRALRLHGAACFIEKRLLEGELMERVDELVEERLEAAACGT